MKNTSPLFQQSAIKRSLVLAGGGIRLAYHAGLLKALEEEGYSFWHVDGTSGGIFNTAMLASGLRPTEMCERWRHLPARYFNALLPVYDYIPFWRLPGFASTNGIRDKVFPFLGIDLAKMKVNEEFLATFNICNFSTKTLENFKANEVEMNLLMAGLSLPIFMPSLKIDGDFFTDGVWVKDSNVMAAVQQGAEEVWLVWCIGDSREYYDGSFVQYVHMLEISSAGGVWHELQWLLMVNRLIELGQSPYGQTKPIKIQVIKPYFPIPLDTDLMMGFTDFRSLLNLGYADTKSYLKNIPENGIALDYKATQMHEPGSSWQFKVHFEGNNQSVFALIDVRDTEHEGFQVYFTGSIRWEDTKTEVPIYEQQTILKTENGEKNLVLIGKINADNIVQNCQITISIKSSLSYHTGQDMKLCRLQLTDNEPIKLNQSFLNRIKSVWQSHLYLNRSLVKRFREKRELMAKFYAKH